MAFLNYWIHTIDVLRTFHLQLLWVLYSVDVEEDGDELGITQVHEEHHRPEDDARDSCQTNRQRW